MWGTHFHFQTPQACYYRFMGYNKRVLVVGDAILYCTRAQGIINY